MSDVGVLPDNNFPTSYFLNTFIFNNIKRKTYVSKTHQIQ